MQSRSFIEINELISLFKKVGYRYGKNDNFTYICPTDRLKDEMINIKKHSGILVNDILFIIEKIKFTLKTTSGDTFFCNIEDLLKEISEITQNSADRIQEEKALNDLIIEIRGCCNDGI